MMIVSVAVLAVSQTLTWQRVAVKHRSIMARKPCSFCLPAVELLQHMYTYIYNLTSPPPFIHIILEKLTSIRVLLILRLFSKANQVFDSVDGSESPWVDLGFATILHLLTLLFLSSTCRFFNFTIQTCDIM